MSKLSLNDENKYEVMLTQALLGVISPNFRMVSIDFGLSVWKVTFTIEQDNQTDREEIKEFESEFYALLPNGQLRFTVEIVVTTAPITWPEPHVRVVYHRRER